MESGNPKLRFIHCAFQFFDFPPLLFIPFGLPPFLLPFQPSLLSNALQINGRFNKAANPLGNKYHLLFVIILDVIYEFILLDEPGVVCFPG